MDQTKAITTVGGSGIITIPEEIVMIRSQWADSKRLELERARTALQHLHEAGATPSRIRRGQETVALLKKVVRALDAGYVPVPRFPSDKLRLDIEELPLKVIVAVNEAVSQKVFDEFRFVQGERSGRAVFGRGRRRTAQRDPIVVGVVRTPTLDFKDEWGRDTPWGLEEHFLVAWWRPEDERLEEMF